MKSQLVLFAILLSLAPSLKCEENTNSTSIGIIPCGNVSCQEGQGICVGEASNKTCICGDIYATFPTDNPIHCTYTKKRQIVAFLLEFFLTYGAGHYYTMNYHFAVPKMLFFIISYCLFIVLRIVSKSSEDSNSASLIICIMALFVCAGMLSWQLADVIMYGYNQYTDGNGIPLISM